MSLIPAQAIKVEEGLDDLKIIAADELNYKDNTMLLSGNVIIQIKDIRIASPKVSLEQKKKAEFTGSVHVSSTDLDLLADRMEIDIPSAFITLFSANSKIQDYEIISDVQTLNLDQGIFRAEALEDSEVLTKYEDMNVHSGFLEVLFEAENEELEDLNQIKFEREILAEKEKSELRGDKLLIFPKLKQYRVIGEASFLDKKEKFLIEADFMNLEEQDELKKDYVLLASTTEQDKQVKVLSEKRKLLAYSSLARLWLKDNELQKLVFTGNSDVRFKDKKLQGEEILFNNETKELISNLDRPKAILLKN